MKSNNELLQKFFIVSLMLIIFAAVPSISYSAGTLTPKEGSSITLTDAETSGKNWEKSRLNSNYKSAVNENEKTVRGWARATLGGKAVTTAYVGTRFSVAKTMDAPGYYSSVWCRVTMNGYYKGVIGALGVSAGRTIIEMRIHELGDPPKLIGKKAILDTMAGGIPSGLISKNFSESIEGCFIPGKTYEVQMEINVSAGTGKGKVAGVIENDFYEGDHLAKYNSIKVEVLRGCTTAGATSASDPGPNEVILYEHINYGGKSKRFSVGTNVSNLTDQKEGNWNWNDKVSSIKVGANVRLITWQDLNYTGKCMTFSGSNTGGASGGNYNDLRGWNLNDAITSLKVRHPAYPEDPEARCP